MAKQVQESKQGQFRYIADDFTNSGQDSFTTAPAQRQAMWENLVNVMPIIQKGVQRRWGYKALNPNITSTVERLDSFQRDSDGLRTIIASGPEAVQAFLESGTEYASNIFTPAASPHSLASRNYAYFFSGQEADLLKWDGSASGGTSKWGIKLEDTAKNVTTSPATGTDITGTVLWSISSASTLALADNVTAATSYASNLSVDRPLRISDFSAAFAAIPLAATIDRITVTIKCAFQSTLGTGQGRLKVNLIKNGNLYGSHLDNALPSGDSSHTTNQIWTSSDNLWGGVWTPADLQNPLFGVNLQPIVFPDFVNPISAGNYFVDQITVTVDYTTSALTMSVASGSPGSVDLTVGRIYFLCFKNSTTAHNSDLTPASNSTGPLSNGTIDITDIPVSPDPQVDVKLLLATSDGGDPASLYLVAELDNSVTSYTDETTEEELVLNQLYQFTDDFGNDFGVAGNTPPPDDIQFVIKHAGRLWGLSDQNLFFSKGTGDLTLPNGFIAGKYEESWPAENFFDISEGAERGRGLYSDGQTIYIGTERSILRVVGDDPSNFSEPEIVHNEAGLLNHEVWQTVFIEGTPAGAMWLTPDARVILSDFNVYTDVGTDIQDILNNINTSIAADISRAAFVSRGPYDLYLLAIPTDEAEFLNTLCVYDMRAKKWFVWKLLNPVRALLFNISATGEPQWLFAGQRFTFGPLGQTFGCLFQFDPTTTVDFTINPEIIAQTSWLNLDNPSAFKLLDEVEAYVGDPNNTFLAIDGADKNSDFNSPVNVVSSKTFRLGPFKTYKAYLAAAATHHKYFRLRFFSNGGGTDPLPFDYLNGYLIRYQLVNSF